jgi:hypothetical protein
VGSDAERRRRTIQTPITPPISASRRVMRT